LALTALSLLRDQVRAQEATAEATPTVNAAATPVASPTSAVTVEMTDQFRFMPEEVTLAVGQAVTWVNASAIPHTSTDDPAKNPVAQAHPEYAQLPAGAEPWDSDLLQPGQSFTHTFTVPGTYAYFCIPHVLSGMRGTITVQG
jgi:plastocyanin